MRGPIPAWRLLLRVALGVLFLTMTAIGIWPSCDTSEVPAAIDVGTGGTYGAEISLSVIGRGRVTSSPPSVDCPSDCFARIVLASASVDGGDGGITLIAQDSPGSHFAGWSFAEVDLGARARGPAACSPMTRKSSVPPSNNDSTVVSVPFGETQGTPPPGHEAECAAFTSVSLAYAVTAKFVEDPPEPGFDAAVDPADLDVLFYPTNPSYQAKEIGVTNGYAYWRFAIDGLPNLSGVAGSDLASNVLNEIVAPDQSIRMFHVDRHAVFQTTDDTLRYILAGQTSTNTLGGAPTCLALASDAQNVYCRAGLDGGTAIYAWPAIGVDVAAPSIVHLLPDGDELGVDTQRFYFFGERTILGQEKLLSAPRDGDGGTPSLTTLASAQSSPRGLAVGVPFLAWLTDPGTGLIAASSVSKFGDGGFPTPGTSAPALRYVAADPSANAYWVGAGGDGTGAWQIYRVDVVNGPLFFRAGNTDLGGVAVDDTYVYWTAANGRVYRSLKSGPEP